MIALFLCQPDRNDQRTTTVLTHEPTSPVAPIQFRNQFRAYSLKALSCSPVTSTMDPLLKRVNVMSARLLVLRDQVCCTVQDEQNYSSFYARRLVIREEALSGI